MPSISCLSGLGNHEGDNGKDHWLQDFLGTPAVHLLITLVKEVLIEDLAVTDASEVVDGTFHHFLALLFIYNCVAIRVHLVPHAFHYVGDLFWRVNSCLVHFL